MLALLATIAAGPLDDQRWRHRIVLVFADVSSESLARRQLDELASVGDGLRVRDVRVLDIIGNTAPPGLRAAELRRAYHPSQGFCVVLVGKDGGVKLRREAPVTAAQLFAAIDAMPMARDEAARRPK